MMRYSTHLSDVVHLMVFITLNKDTSLTSRSIAESIKTNLAYIRKFMSILKSEGLIINTTDHPRPALARDASETSLLDAYRVMEDDMSLLHSDTNTNPECRMGVIIQISLKDYYNEIQSDIKANMTSITLQDIIDNYRKRCELCNFDF